MRKLISLILIACLMMTLALPALAAEESAATPRYTYFNNLACDLTIDSDGTAHCTAQAQSKNLSDKVVLLAYLEGHNNSDQSTLYSWTASGTRIASFSRTISVSSTYPIYRLRVEAYVKDSSNNLLESRLLYDTAYYTPSN